MFMNYNLDIRNDYTWKVFISSKSAKNLSFYILEVGKFYAFKNFYTERSGRNDYFLLFTLDGQGELQYEKQRMLLNKNSAVLFNCLSYQKYNTGPPDFYWDHFWLRFNGTDCKKYLELINGENEIRMVNIAEPQRLISNINELLQTPNVGDINQNIISSIQITDILNIILTNNLTNTREYLPYPKAVQIAHDYINEHYTESISLDILADRVHLSKYYFIKLFCKHIGTTPYAYIINCRINEAQRLLSTTDKSVVEIAGLVGFSDESSFISKFKAATGQTPQKFRVSIYDFSL